MISGTWEPMYLEIVFDIFSYMFLLFKNLSLENQYWPMIVITKREFLSSRNTPCVWKILKLEVVFGSSHVIL